MDGNSTNSGRDGIKKSSETDSGQIEQLLTHSEPSPEEVTDSGFRSHDTGIPSTNQEAHPNIQAVAAPPSETDTSPSADTRDSVAVQTATQNLVSALEKHRSPQNQLTDSGKTSPAQSMPPQNGQATLSRSNGVYEQTNPNGGSDPHPVKESQNPLISAPLLGPNTLNPSETSSILNGIHRDSTYSNTVFDTFPISRGQSAAVAIAEEEECAQSVEEDDIPQAIIDAQSYGRVPAYAKLVFPDGLYYMTTLYLTLGRDVLALKAAQEYYGDRSQRNSRGAEIDKSRPANSLVSLEGGINGFDHDQNPNSRSNLGNSQASSSSGYGTVAPQQLQRKKPFDYEQRIKLTQEATPARKRETPKTVDTQALLPNHNERPLLPIHPRADLDGAEEIAGHKSISRRHLQISWNDEMGRFESECLGVNGYYLNSQFRPQGSVDPLDANSLIEIGGIDIRWELPSELIPEHEPVSGDESDSLQNVLSDGELQSANEAIESIETPDATTTAKRKIRPSIGKDTATHAADVVRNSTQPDQPLKRKRGRPPKGEVPQRVLAERRREEKAAKAREGNGGVTPPPKPVKRPVGRPRMNKESVDGLGNVPKPEKRKYTKRKHVEVDDNNESSLPAEVADGEDGPVDDAKQAKKQLDVLCADLPDLSTYTDEQKERPKLPYKHLIYQEFVKDPTPKNLTGVYAALVVSWPFFRTLSSSGWQSSVRHNLLGEKQLFEGIETEGRGKLWKLKDGAVLEPAAKKRLSPPAVPSTMKHRGALPIANGAGSGKLLNGYMTGTPPQQYPPNFLNGIYGMVSGGQYPSTGTTNGVSSANGALGHQMSPTNGSIPHGPYHFSPLTASNPQMQGFPRHLPNGYQQSRPLQDGFTNGDIYQTPTDASQQLEPSNPNGPPQQAVKFIANFQGALLKSASLNQREETEAMFDAVRAIVLHGKNVDTGRFQPSHFEAVISHVREVAKKYGWLDGKKWPAPVQAAVGDGANKAGDAVAPEDTSKQLGADQEANEATVRGEEMES